MELVSFLPILGSSRRVNRRARGSARRIDLAVGADRVSGLIELTADTRRRRPLLAHPASEVTGLATMGARPLKVR